MPVKREFLPGLFMDVWGFNGTMPGPTIEAVQGDRVRLVVHNELPESTAIHWHGLEMPVRFDGVPGLTQQPIRPGETYAYEFDLHQNGTYFYHSHDAMQEGIGMIGLFIIHPKVPHEPRVDRDFALVSQEWAVLPGATIPNTMSMEFNLFTFNGRSGPYVTPLVCKLGERVRIRFVNFSAIDHHPFHLHGVTFWVTGTEGGRIPPSAWIPGNTVLVAVAQVRRDRVHRQQRGGLAAALPHVSPHDELHELDGRADGRSHRPGNAGRTEPDRRNGDRDRRSGSVIGGVRPEHGPQHG